MNLKRSREIRRIVSGDRAAGRAFVTEHYPRVYRFLRHLTGREVVAEDLTQQTFLKAWEALPAFRGDASLATWLHRIAYHEYTHWLRGRREELPLDDHAPTAFPASCPVEALLLRDAFPGSPRSTGTRSSSITSRGFQSPKWRECWASRRGP